MELTDGAFVAKARGGDADAFRLLVDRHSRRLFHLAFRMTGNEQDAEDVVQESFLRAYRRLSQFDERASFGTWLYRIAGELLDRFDAVEGPARAGQRNGVGRSGAIASFDRPDTGTLGTQRSKSATGSRKR